MTEPSAAKSSKSIGVVGATLIGVGGMVGGGIFAVLGTAVMQAKGGTPIAFGLAGLVALLTAYSYAKLSVRFPRSGGTAVFLDHGFGVNLFTGMLNLILWLSYLVTIALYASAFGSYAVTFFDQPAPWLKHVFITLAIMMPAAINLLNAELVSKSETAIVIVKIVLLCVVIAAGAFHTDVSRLTPDTWAPFTALVIGGMVIFVAFEGFELIANAAEDVKNPKRTLPRAYFLCVGSVIALYMVVAAVTVGSVDTETIIKAKDYALAEAARPSLGQAGFILVSVSALMATFSAINATIYGNARLGFTLATEGELPGALGKRVWHRPVNGVVVTMLISALLANTIDLEAIAILASAGFLLIFAAVSAAAFRLGPAIGANRIITALATLASSGALLALLISSANENLHALFVFGGLIVIAFLFELIYPKLTTRKMRNWSHH
ncbi:MAG: APC family permease [Verrucomicrobiota bacterium]